MLINLLVARDYLLVVLILLPVSNQRSLNADHLQRTNATAADGPKSVGDVKVFAIAFLLNIPELQ